MYRKKNQFQELGICLADELLTMFSLFVMGLLRYGSVLGFFNAENVEETFIIVFIIEFAAYYGFKAFNGFYRRDRYDELILSIKINLIIVAGSAFIGFLLKREFFVSRLVMGTFFVFNTLLIWVFHLFIRNCSRLLGRKNEMRGSNLFVVTSGPEKLIKIKKKFEVSREIQWNIVGAVFVNSQPEGEMIEGIPVISDKRDDYLTFATQHVVDEVFIQLDDIQENEDLIRSMILEFENMGVVVNLSLDLFNMGISGEKRVYSLEGYNVIAFSSRLFDYRLILIKRLIDIVGSIVGLIITFLIGIVLAPILLHDSPGPLIFKQKRVGKNGRIFNIYKFRSMYTDAEERKADLMDRNEVDGPMFKMDNDPRVTKVGAFIRRTSIDELPQFWNVLKGDMSLVGTRPPTVDEYVKYNYYQKRRISFKPGITGLWQISGRSDIKDFNEVVKLDLEYIDNWSLTLDIKIIFRTIVVVLKQRGAK